jgi:hypothetical protein
MLHWALMFLLVALVAAHLRFRRPRLDRYRHRAGPVRYRDRHVRGKLVGRLLAPQSLRQTKTSSTSGGFPMSFRLLAVVVAGALAAACTTTETRTVVVPAPADDSCGYYGYARGTEGYRICAEREAAARRRGRMAAHYAEARLAADAHEACRSYGLMPGSDRYDRCVQREISYRRPM